VACSTQGKRRGAYQVFVGRFGETSEDNIKIVLEEVGWRRGLDLCLDTDRWWALVNATVDTEFP